MKVVCISDTHTQHEQLTLPPGDILIHSGDVSWSGSIQEVAKFCHWFNAQPHKYKVLIAGNHDFLFQNNPSFCRTLLDESVTYLEDREAVIHGLRIYGSPWTPRFYDWAFMLDPHADELKEKWAMIPDGLDILVTHGPPLGILDINAKSVSCGDYHLAERVKEVKPSFHVFGHIHESHGMKEVDGTTYVNAASMKDHSGFNLPISFEV